MTETVATGPLPPSGEQFAISFGDQSAIAVAVGGGLRTYDVAGRAVLDGYDIDDICDGARCQTLIPWPNRVKDGSWQWDGVDQQLPLSEPEQHNAIHGLARWLEWRPRGGSESSIELGCEVAPQPGYPWRLELTNRWSLGDAGLEVLTTVVNRSRTAAPVAAGFHPYLTVGTSTIDDAVLTIPGRTRILTGEQQIPVGDEPVDGTAYDFRDARPLGGLEIDHTYTDLERDGDGLARLRMTAGAGGASATLWLDEAYPYLEVFTGDALPDPARRRKGLGVEPMSAPPNALASGTSVVRLEPGGRWQGRWGIDPFG